MDVIRTQLTPCSVPVKVSTSLDRDFAEGNDTTIQMGSHSFAGCLLIERFGTGTSLEAIAPFPKHSDSATKLSRVSRIPTVAIFVHPGIISAQSLNLFARD